MRSELDADSNGCPSMLDPFPATTCRSWLLGRGPIASTATRPSPTPSCSSAVCPPGSTRLATRCVVETVRPLDKCESQQRSGVATKRSARTTRQDARQPVADDRVALTLRQHRHQPQRRSVPKSFENASRLPHPEPSAHRSCHLHQQTTLASTVLDPAVQTPGR